MSLLRSCDSSNILKSPHTVVKEKFTTFQEEKESIEERIRDDMDGQRERVVRTVIQEALKDVKISLWVEKDGEKQNIQMQNLLGCGGQKKAWEFSEQQALLLPNYDRTPVKIYEQFWKESMEQEIRVSEFLTQHDMMNCHHQAVKVFSEEKSDTFIPAYLSDSFDYLKTKNIFIIEGKANSSKDSHSTWVKGNNQFLFQDPNDRLKEECWDGVFEPLLIDMTKIIRYGIPALDDSRNIAIVKDDNQTASPYLVRYFGFDFSTKEGARANCLKERVNFTLTSLQHDVSLLVSDYVGRVMEIEFYQPNNEEIINYSELEKSLVEKYTKLIVDDILGNLQSLNHSR